MIKVLMFGWEYPPHISGGLGTACYGLTRALQKNKVKVLFAIPRLYGGEGDSQIKFIDVSSVARRNKDAPSANVRNPPYKPPDLADKNENEQLAGSVSYIGVPVALQPYLPAETTQGEAQQYLTMWNYTFSPSHVQEGGNRAEAMTNAATLAESEEREDVTNLTGKYGPNLMDEVYRYADVADNIATQHTFDVIHAHDWMTFLAAIAAKKKSGKPLVIHIHSTEFDRSGDHVNEMIYGIEKMGLTEADHIIAVSNWAKQIVVSKYKIAEEKISVVHNGIIPKPKPKEFSFPEIGSHFVTFLGRVTHQKGPAFFVEAAEKVLREFPDAHFIVAGAGDLLPHIIEKVAQLNMSANFHFTGFLSREQVDQVWSLTDVYVMPSVSEPFGIAPLEAIQGGVPVILSKQSGVAEVMPHAIKVDFWDTKAVAAAICSVLRYESLSHVLRQNSQKHIKNLTWEKAAVDVKAIYYELTRK